MKKAMKIKMIETGTRTTFQTVKKIMRDDYFFKTRRSWMVGCRIEAHKRR